MNEPLPSPASAIEALRSSVARVPRVVLRQAGEEMHETPVLRPAVATSGAGDGLPQRIGPYLVAGEIAHGGIGVILKARDTDLGRDVALKVLHARHRGNQDLLRRFIEEAQIGSQLQHPGIVPLHGLGVLSDGLPYLAMKLVKGRTLAAILETRRDPAHDQQRLLGVFERVCQAMAYAHARRVVHRDLKPANVMVGAFGEVQLMDWGLAKVLSRPEAIAPKERPAAAASIIATIRSATGSSQSLAGSVFGTPAYMAPEQARGRLESVDERSDVFGLGAMLCEILTGSPPYTGETQEAIYEKARKGYLDDAYSRLGACGAPGDLVDLTRRALAFEPRERPGDAGALAQAVKSHLDSLEESRRRLGIEAAASRARSHEERRARRLLLGFAAAAIVLLLSAGWVWIAVDRESRRAQSETASSAQESLETAQRLLGEARASAGAAERAWARQGRRWERAVEAAHEAGRRSAGAPAAAMAAARELREAVETETVQAREAALREERNQRMVAELDDIRLRSYAYLSWPRLHADYRQAFHGFGIEVESLTADEAAKAIEASGIVLELGMAIAKWAWCKHELFGDKAPGTSKLWLVADRVDPDPFRKRLRAAVAGSEMQELQKLAAEARGRELPAPTLELLVDVAGAAGGNERATQLLLEALHRDPAQASLHALLLIKTVDSRLALASWISSVSLRPDSVEARRLVRIKGPVFLHQPWTEEAARMQPGEASDMDALGNLRLTTESNSFEALAWFEEVLRIDPTSDGAAHNRAFLLNLMGDTDGAIRSYESVLRQTRGAVTLHNLGYLRRRLGDIDGAVAAWTEAIATRGQDAPTQATLHSEIGKAFDVRGDLAAAAYHQRQAQLLAPNDPWPWYWLGAIFLKQGRLADALVQFQGALERDSGDTGDNAFLMVVPALEELHLPASDLRLRAILEALANTLESGMAARRFAHPRLRAALVRVHEALLEPLPPAEALEKARTIAGRRAEIPELRALPGFVAWRAGARREAILRVEDAVGEVDPRSPLARRLGEMRAAVRPNLLTFGSIDAALEDEDRLLAAGETWRFFRGVADPAPGPAWTEAGFDDSSWEQGPSGFGYGDGDDATLLGDMAGRYTSVFVRSTVTIPELRSGERVELRVHSDDGFAAHVNGQSAGRVRVGPPMEKGGFLTQALNHEATDADVLDITHLMVPGPNQLAIQGVNESATSSDFSLIPEVYVVHGEDPERDAKVLDAFRAVAVGDDAPARLAYLESRVLERSGRQTEALVALERAVTASPAALLPLSRLIANLDAAGRGVDASARLEAACRSGLRVPPELLDRWIESRRAAGAGWGEILAAWPRRAAPYELVLSPRAREPGVVWRYTRERPEAGWAAPGFDASGWSEGEAAFGSPLHDMSILPRTVWPTPHIWLRRRFTVDLPEKLPGGVSASLVVYAAHDDDAEVYLNGVEIARLGGWTHSHARVIRPGFRPLSTGENMLAVHCHNPAADGYIDVELVLRIATTE